METKVEREPLEQLAETLLEPTPLSIDAVALTTAQCRLVRRQLELRGVYDD